MKISFDRVADIYDKTRGLPQNVMEKVVKALAKELKGYDTVLDIGIGTGRFAEPLQEKGFEVIGVDISRDMIQKAKEKKAKNLLLSDACFLPFKESYFDATLCVHVLHLISNWQTALKEICRATKYGLFSVTHMGQSNPVHEAYEESAKEKGYNVRRIGLGERELSELIKPTKSVPAASWVSSADERLTYLSQRAYSRQWRLPEDVDKQIVQELVKRFIGQKYPVEMHILKWDVKDLKSYLRTYFKKSQTSLQRI